MSVDLDIFNQFEEIEDDHHIEDFFPKAVPSSTTLFLYEFSSSSDSLYLQSISLHKKFYSVPNKRL